MIKIETNIKSIHQPFQPNTIKTKTNKNSLLFLLLFERHERVYHLLKLSFKFLERKKNICHPLQIVFFELRSFGILTNKHERPLTRNS